jgi:hypothetical protein
MRIIYRSVKSSFYLFQIAVHCLIYRQFYWFSNESMTYGSIFTPFCRYLSPVLLVESLLAFLLQLYICQFD